MRIARLTQSVVAIPILFLKKLREPFPIRVILKNLSFQAA